MTTTEQPRILLQGEEIIYHQVLYKGIFRKKVTEVQIVTNRRVIKDLPLTGYFYVLELQDIDDVQVLNRRNDSNSNMTGVGVRANSVRTMQFQGQSRSRVIGSVLFMSRNHQDFSFDNVSDCMGLANVVKSAIKMLPTTTN